MALSLCEASGAENQKVVKILGTIEIKIKKHIKGLKLREATKRRTGRNTEVS